MKRSTPFIDPALKPYINKLISVIKPHVALVCVMLLWAIFYEDNPYAYYQLLRIVCFGVFVYIAIDLYRTIVLLRTLSLKTSDLKVWTWIFLALALIYNPFVPFHLERDEGIICWQNINWLTIATMVVFEAYLIKEKVGIIVAIALLAGCVLSNIIAANIREEREARLRQAYKRQDQEYAQKAAEREAEREAQKQRTQQVLENQEWLKERQERQARVDQAQWKEWIDKQYGELGAQRGRLARLELEAERRGDHDAAMKYREEAKPITDKIAQIHNNLEEVHSFDSGIPKALPVEIRRAVPVTNGDTVGEL